MRAARAQVDSEGLHCQPERGRAAVEVGLRQGLNGMMTMLWVLAGAAVSRLPPLQNRAAQAFLTVVAASVPVAAWFAAFR